MKKLDKKKIIKKIERLKKKHHAIILAHNYQLPEVQDIADYCGDSLGLSRIAAGTKARVVIFCGVHFMAETASILCPKKKIIMPNIESGCPMADMITPEELQRLKLLYPQATVVGYVNTSAAVKAELDYCCTSANAVSVVKALKNKKEIIFVPDKNLAAYVSKKTRKKLIVWDGYCPVHANILPRHIQRAKKLHPQASVIVHPECIPAVIDLATAVLSTSQMCKFVKQDSAKEYIIGTEPGLIYRLKKENPKRGFFPASDKAVCPDMKYTTAESILHSLEKLKVEVKVPEDIRKRAKKAIARMLEIL